MFNAPNANGSVLLYVKRQTPANIIIIIIIIVISIQIRSD